MPYRLMPGVPLVCVRNQAGKIVYHYASPIRGMFGPIIPWLSDDQAAYLIRIGYVEPIDDIETETPPDRVNACIAALDSVGLPLEAGAPTAREALRDAGHRFGNDIVAASLKLRKSLSRTAQ